MKKKKRRVFDVRWCGRNRDSTGLNVDDESSTEERRVKTRESFRRDKLAWKRILSQGWRRPRCAISNIKHLGRLWKRDSRCRDSTKYTHSSTYHSAPSPGKNGSIMRGHHIFHRYSFHHPQMKFIRLQVARLSLFSHLNNTIMLLQPHHFLLHRQHFIINLFITNFIHQQLSHFTYTNTFCKNIIKAISLSHINLWVFLQSSKKISCFIFFFSFLNTFCFCKNIAAISFSISNCGCFWKKNFVSCFIIFFSFEVFEEERIEFGMVLS